MRCPIDQTELLMTERHGVEIDYCPKCRGVWLDRGELDKIIELSTPEVALPDPDPAPAYAPEPRRDVPRAPLRERRSEPRRDDRYEDRYEDRREHRSWDEENRRDDYKAGKRYKKKRRKSFLEEVFDIFD